MASTIGHPVRHDSTMTLNLRKLSVTLSWPHPNRKQSQVTDQDPAYVPMAASPHSSHNNLSRSRRPSGHRRSNAVDLRRIDTDIQNSKSSPEAEMTKSQRVSTEVDPPRTLFCPVSESSGIFELESMPTNRKSSDAISPHQKSYSCLCDVNSASLIPAPFAPSYRNRVFGIDTTESIDSGTAKTPAVPPATRSPKRPSLHAHTHTHAHDLVSILPEIKRQAAARLTERGLIVDRDLDSWSRLWNDAFDAQISPPLGSPLSSRASSSVLSPSLSRTSSSVLSPSLSRSVSRIATSSMSSLTKRENAVLGKSDTGSGSKGSYRASSYFEGSVSRYDEKEKGTKRGRKEKGNENENEKEKEEGKGKSAGGEPINDSAAKIPASKSTRNAEACDVARRISVSRRHGLEYQVSHKCGDGAGLGAISSPALEMRNKSTLIAEENKVARIDEGDAERGHHGGESTDNDHRFNHISCSDIDTDTDEDAEARDGDDYEEDCGYDSEDDDGVLEIKVEVGSVLEGDEGAATTPRRKSFVERWILSLRPAGAGRCAPVLLPDVGVDNVVLGKAGRPGCGRRDTVQDEA